MPTVYDGPLPYDAPLPYEPALSASTLIVGHASTLATRPKVTHDAQVDI